MNYSKFPKYNYFQNHSTRFDKVNLSESRNGVPKLTSIIAKCAYVEVRNTVLFIKYPANFSIQNHSEVKRSVAKNKPVLALT